LAWKTSKQGQKYRTGGPVVIEEIKKKILGLSGGDLIVVLLIFVLFAAFVLKTVFGLLESDFEICADQCERAGKVIERFDSEKMSCKCQVVK
jgi:hypothetical protein